MKKWLAVALGTGLVLTYAGTGHAEKADKQDKTKWKMVWSDEFTKQQLDRTKWNYDTGNWIVDADGNGVSSGWGNNEKQYYTDKKDNAFIRDGKLVIRAKQEKTTDAFGSYDYTSAKLKTKGLFSKTYGRYEIKAKLPTGKGLWPAFWMLPEQDKYGAWASSGEIDVMESWGSQPEKVAGTIHYGENWPNNKYTGKDYHFPDGERIDQWHTYAVEWEPGELRWYVDGNLYQTQNDWYSKGKNTATNYSYPAPFDQNFYLVMNLAVGGWFDGEVDATTKFPAEMEVDYVRVYDLKNRAYREPVEPVYEDVTLPDGAKQPLEDGNLVYDQAYEKAIKTITDGAQTLDPTYWNYVTLPDFGGTGSVDVTEQDGTRFADVMITKPGAQTYSHQLIQNVSLAQGGRYQVSFDASSDQARKMVVKVGGGAERGYTKYSNEESIDLTTTVKPYTFTFDMTGETDLAARLEFNLGLAQAGVKIGNVRVEQIPRGEIDEAATKPALPDGNQIYNGTFDQGAMDRLTYWQFDAGKTKGTGSVDPVTRVFTFKTNTKKGQNATLSQQGVQLVKDHQYVLRFKAAAKRVNKINVQLTDATETTAYLPEQRIAPSGKMETFEVPFTMTEATDLKSRLQFILGSEKGEVAIDDVELFDTTPIEIDKLPLKNGSFTEGLNFWSSYVHYDAQAVVSTVNEAAKIAIASEGQEPWSVLLEQGNLALVKGQTYQLTFKASSTVARPLEVTVENAAYTRYFSQVVELGTEAKTYQFDFTLGQDDTAGLKFLMGKAAGSPFAAHDVTIDDVKLEVK
ncbi:MULTISPECIES: carbohydrate binding domain-containing protein [unclassified Exiguobacterium]|uniref:carbohydrate binding domain-containing protein n=1 Tax=unclassified Exiguobacterium TaxID=2644629 RepID=UPI001BE770B8|nr:MULTISPECIES: carbohydrate binding domain-containing protein [unclassified Exiguobacterium]